MCLERQKLGDFRIWIPGSCSSSYSPPIPYRPKNNNFEYLAIDAPFKRYEFSFSSGYDCYTYQKDAPNYKKAKFVCKSNNRIKLLYTASVWRKQKCGYFLMEIPDDAGEFHSHSGRIVISEKLSWEDQGSKYCKRSLARCGIRKPKRNLKKLSIAVGGSEYRPFGEAPVQMKGRFSKGKVPKAARHTVIGEPESGYSRA